MNDGGDALFTAGTKVSKTILILILLVLVLIVFNTHSCTVTITNNADVMIEEEYEES